MAVCRRTLTLIELLVVIALLSLVGGLAAIGINKALVDQRFRTEVSLVIDELRLAQDLMLILGTDVHVKFAEDRQSNRNKFWLELETALPSGIERELLKRSGALKTVKGIFFRDLNSAEVTPGQIDIRFLSGGDVMSKGVLRLATSDQEDPPKGTLQNFICLPGYPKLISSVDDQAKIESDCDFAAETAQDLRFTQDTFSKLPESLKLPDEPETPQEEANENQGAERPETPPRRNSRTRRQPDGSS